MDSIPPPPGLSKSTHLRGATRNDLYPPIEAENRGLHNLPETNVSDATRSVSKLMSPLPTTDELTRQILHRIVADPRADIDYAAVSVAPPSKPVHAASTRTAAAATPLQSLNDIEEMLALVKQLKETDGMIKVGRETLRQRSDELYQNKLELQASVQVASSLLQSYLKSIGGFKNSHLDKGEIQSIVQELNNAMHIATDSSTAVDAMHMAGSRAVRFAEDKLSVRSPSRRAPKTPSTLPSAAHAPSLTHLASAGHGEPGLSSATHENHSTLLSRHSDVAAVTTVKGPSGVISAVVADALGSDDLDTLVLAQAYAASASRFTVV